MLYRIDTFTLPEGARAEFDLQSNRVLDLLRRQPGFVSDQVFTKVAGTGAVDVVTIATWKDEDSIANAGAAVRALHAELGFDAAEFARRHGIVESKAVYVQAGRSHDADRRVI